MAVGANAKQDAKSQRIAALEQLIAVLRKQQAGMRRSLAEKDRHIWILEERIKQHEGSSNHIGWYDCDGNWHHGLMPLDTAQNSVTIHRNE